MNSHRTMVQRAKEYLAYRRALGFALEISGKRRVSPHTIRHTTAMHMLQAGVDLSVIALWLGHESNQTTHHYLQADFETKKKALSAVEPPNLSRSTRTPSTPLFQFLERL